MLKTVAGVLLAVLLPGHLEAADAPAKIYDLSEVFAKSWLNLGRTALDEGDLKASDSNKVIMRSFEEGGIFWNTNPLPCGAYELGLDLYLNIPDSVADSNFEGLGLWIIDNSTMNEISDSYLSRSADRELFNYRTDYVGYGTFFSMTNRKGIIKPSISVLFNDGTPLKPKEIPTAFGLFHNFTQNPQVQMSLSVRNKHVTTRTKTLTGEWKKITGVSGGQPVCGFLGISASNKRGNDKTTDTVSRGADVLFVNATLTTTDASVYQQIMQEARPQDEGVDEDLPKLAVEENVVLQEDKVAAEPPLIVQSPNKEDKDLQAVAADEKSRIVKASLNKAASKNLKQSNTKPSIETPAVAPPPFEPEKLRQDQQASPALVQDSYDHSKLEEMLKLIQQNLLKLEISHRKLTSDVQNLHKSLGAESVKSANTEAKRDQQNLVRQQRLDSMLSELREMLKKSGESRAINIADTHKSFEDLQANAASLESTVRMASTYSTYLAAGLFVSFIVFGGVIYKRMKDMEKKHFL